MLKNHRNAAAIALLALSLTISACATPAPPAATPTETPTVEPTEPPVTEPQSALPLDCEQVIATASVIPVFVTPVELRNDQTSTPRGLGAAAFVQGGGLSCAWGGDLSGTGYHEGLQLTIVAATAAEFAPYVSSSESEVTDTLGDRSLLHCFLQEAGGYTCGADILVGDYWIDASVGDTGEGFTTDSALATATELLTKVVENVDAAGSPRALWSPPADAFDGATLCSDPAHVAAALGVDPAGLSVVVNTFPWTGAGGLAISRTPVISCKWTAGETSMYVDALPGGGWWAEQLAVAPPGDAAHYKGPTAIQVPGVDAAYLSANDGGGVIILFSRGSVATLSLAEYDESLLTSAATAFAATLGG